MFKDDFELIFDEDLITLLLFKNIVTILEVEKEFMELKIILKSGIKFTYGDFEKCFKSWFMFWF